MDQHARMIIADLVRQLGGKATIGMTAQMNYRAGSLVILESISSLSIFLEYIDPNAPIEETVTVVEQRALPAPGEKP